MSTRGALCSSLWLSVQDTAPLLNSPIWSTSLDCGVLFPYRTPDTQNVLYTFWVILSFTLLPWPADIKLHKPEPLETIKVDAVYHMLRAIRGSEDPYFDALRLQKHIFHCHYTMSQHNLVPTSGYNGTSQFFLFALQHKQDVKTVTKTSLTVRHTSSREPCRRKFLCVQ
jgi:hypothetical protein